MPALTGAPSFRGGVMTARTCPASASFLVVGNSRCARGSVNASRTARCGSTGAPAGIARAMRTVASTAARTARLAATADRRVCSWLAALVLDCRLLGTRDIANPRRLGRSLRALLEIPCDMTDLITASAWACPIPPVGGRNGLVVRCDAGAVS